MPGQNVQAPPEQWLGSRGTAKYRWEVPQPDDYGPSRAVAFIGEGTREEQEIARRDAYERTAYFLKGLKGIS